MTKAQSSRLSKSKVVLGVQCPKALYLQVNEPGLASTLSATQQMIFDQGTAVGVYAQSLYPGGTLIHATYHEIDLALAQTQAAIAAGSKHIFEATFIHMGVLVKVDILTRPNVNSPWQIVEVKSSTKMKKAYLPDAAIQRWVVQGAGLEVSSVSVMHINHKCKFPDLKNLLIGVDVTAETAALQDEMPQLVAKFHHVVAQPSAHDVDIGPHCDSPYACAFKAHCWSTKNVPDLSTFDLPRISADKKWELYANKTISLDSVTPSDFTRIQVRMINCTLANQRFVDKAAIQTEMSKWSYPLYYLDFETIAHAIPKYEGTHPYQHLPFQFSCHIQRSKDQVLEHAEFLNTQDCDPREAVAKALADLLAPNATLVAYNMSFEKQVIASLCEQLPKYAKNLEPLLDRFVDPWPIFKAHVYDPEFRGSFSIKDVAPAILGDDASYADMSVSDGGAAQIAYVEIISPQTSAARKDELEQQLLAYCKKDTQCMVDLVWWLMGQRA